MVIEMDKIIRYRIEISFPEKLRNIIREKLKELKELSDSYHQIRDYQKESNSIN